MNLLVNLTVRLVSVVVICLGTAIAWVVMDTHRTLEAETTSTADRVSKTLETLFSA